MKLLWESMEGRSRCGWESEDLEFGGGRRTGEEDERYVRSSEVVFAGKRAMHEKLFEARAQQWRERKMDNGGDRGNRERSTGVEALVTR